MGDQSEKKYTSLRPWAKGKEKSKVKTEGQNLYWLVIFKLESKFTLIQD